MKDHPKLKPKDIRITGVKPKFETVLAENFVKIFNKKPEYWTKLNKVLKKIITG